MRISGMHLTGSFFEESGVYYRNLFQTLQVTMIFNWIILSTISQEMILAINGFSTQPKSNHVNCIYFPTDLQGKEIYLPVLSDILMPSLSLCTRIVFRNARCLTRVHCSVFSEHHVSSLLQKIITSILHPITLRWLSITA